MRWATASPTSSPEDEEKPSSGWGGRSKKEILEKLGAGWQEYHGVIEEEDETAEIGDGSNHCQIETKVDGRPTEEISILSRGTWPQVSFRTTPFHW